MADTPAEPLRMRSTSNREMAANLFLLRGHAQKEWINVEVLWRRQRFIGNDEPFLLAGLTFHHAPAANAHYRLSPHELVPTPTADNAALNRVIESWCKGWREPFAVTVFPSGGMHPPTRIGCLHPHCETLLMWWHSLAMAAHRYPDTETPSWLIAELLDSIEAMCADAVRARRSALEKAALSVNRLTQ